MSDELDVGSEDTVHGRSEDMVHGRSEDTVHGRAVSHYWLLHEHCAL
jgi:hypothetical protein